MFQTFILLSSFHVVTEGDKSFTSQHRHISELSKRWDRKLKDETVNKRQGSSWERSRVPASAVAWSSPAKSAALSKSCITFHSKNKTSIPSCSKCKRGKPWATTNFQQKALWAKSSQNLSCSKKNFQAPSVFGHCWWSLSHKLPLL